MDIDYDVAKRDLVLAERGLDMADAGKVFDGFHLTRADDKHSSEEERQITVGSLDNDVAIIVWTDRKDRRRIITMWKANEKERHKYHQLRDRYG